MITPNKINKNSKVIVLSPAGYVNKDFVVAAEKFFANKGLKPSIYPSCLKKHNRYAGTDSERIKDLQQAINDTEASIILCSRGGYGTLRIIDKIDFTLLQNNPKWIIGFSDITILHSAVNKVGVKSIHGPMAKAFFEEPESESISKLFDILNHIPTEYSIEPDSYNKIGESNAILTGGNLSTIFSLQGTPFELDTDNKILFIEDLNEYLYHLDRIMLNLKLSGKLKNLKGLVVGAFTDMIDSEISFGKTAYQIISEHTQDFNYPVCFNFPAGHIRNNMPLVFGSNYSLSVTKNGADLKMESN